MTPEYKAALDKHGNCTSAYHIQTIIELEAREARSWEAGMAARDYLLGKPNSDGLKRVIEQLEAALSESSDTEERL